MLSDPNVNDWRQTDRDFGGGAGFRGPVLIVALSASDRFGGEAALPLHYFRGLRRRGVEVWLLTHARVREELEETMPEEFDRIEFVEDTVLQRICWQLAAWMPGRLRGLWSLSTIGLATQFTQRRIAKQLVHQHGIRVVHQPTPVSPKHPSLLFALGAPVVIGPMNGGMTYPKAFRAQFEGWGARGLIAVGRLAAPVVNLLLPGKRLAAKLLVANERTKKALPRGCNRQVAMMNENAAECNHRLGKVHAAAATAGRREVSFVYVGRLIRWKGVDFLLEALRIVTQSQVATLHIVGAGEESEKLRALSARLGVEGKTQFHGYLPRERCLELMQRSTALVLPSLYECGGAVVLEAMSVGVPVIATKWGGPTDYLNASCGILVDPTSKEEFVHLLAEAMLRLAEHPQLAEEMGARGRDRVAGAFTWEQQIDRMLKHYKSVVRSDNSSALHLNKREAYEAEHSSHWVSKEPLAATPAASLPFTERQA